MGTAVALARSLEGLSRLRGKRIFHPNGIGFSGVLMPIAARDTPVPLWQREAELVVRLSRSFGLPERAPDPCGLGLRVPDAYGSELHQDVLLISSGRAPLARHVPLPARGFCHRHYSSILPYEIGGRLQLLGARAIGGQSPGPRLAELRESERSPIDFELEVADPRGSWSPVARLSLGRRLPAEETERLDLDPCNTGGGLELAGFLNRLRGPSYRGSQAGRRRSSRAPSQL